MLLRRIITYLLLAAPALLLQHEGYAQLKAGFTIDHTEGCSPLAVHFSNTTTGASSSAIFTWDFGNGNASSLQDADAVFRNETSYVITLTVADSNATSSVSHTVTVYPKPTVDFSAAAQKGCSPLSVDFTGNANATNGNIASYYWDFGDGITQQSADSKINHIYTNAARPAVSLTVTDNHGCQSNLVKNNIVTILPVLVASFAADKAVLCKITDAATFTNNSSGPGTLSYQWDFGDGATSTAKQPSHVFSKEGVYSITLTVNSSEGCTVTSTQNNLLNAANFKSSIAIPGPVCENTATSFPNVTEFDNKSTPAPDKSVWDFGDGYPLNTTGTDSVLRYFGAAGAYTLKSANTFGTCTDTLILPIVVKKSPVVKGFIDSLVDICGSPATVNFKDTTAAAVKWQWNSSGYSNFEATTQAASYKFSYDDSYYVTVKVTDNAGCMGVSTKTVSIYRPNVKVSTPEDLYGNGVTSCGPLTVHLVVTTSDSLKSYSWDLGDGTTSTVAAPVHLYNKAGNYYVKLHYTTLNGCTGEADLYYAIAIRDNVKADFTIPNANICGNTPVTFINLTPLVDYYTYTWSFGDNQTGVSYWNQGYNNITHQYQDSGLYTVTLIASNGICADTITKKNYIKISPPFPKINSFSNTCEGTRGEVTFNQSSTQVSGGIWNFGDGTTAPFADQPQIKHTYTKTGYFHVVLTTTNGACTVGDSIYVDVLLKQYPVLTGDKTEVCSRNDFLKLTYSNLEADPTNYNNSGYSYNGWFHSDGSFAIGVVGGGDQSTIPFYISVGNFTPGDSLRSIVFSGPLDCPDTTNFIPLTGGPIPGFKQVFINPCGSSSTVTLEDTSKPQFGSALVSWVWDFGDGTTATYNHGGRIAHTYRYQGYNTYNVTLTVTDAGGCQALYYANAATSANLLSASLSPSATTISPGSSISFTNTTQTSDVNNTIYQWAFGDGTLATTTDAVKTYPAPGNYKVQLIATNTLTGCRDTASVIIAVKFVNAAFAFNSSYISNSKCPPVVVRFTNTSSNVSTISWDFGDGSRAINVFNPTHVYTKAGKFFVTVTTQSDNGTQYITKDSVIIDEPTVAFKADILHSCTAQSVTFSATATNTSSYLWDFGDGQIYLAADTFAIHNYPSAGIYIPHIIATDANGCSASVNAGDTIVIDSLHVSLGNLAAKICAPKEIVFNPDVVSISGNRSSQSLTYHWNFGTGNPADTASEKNVSFMYQQPGSYLLSLKVQSQYGCVQQATKNILASQGLGAYITGPAEICQANSAVFKGNTKISGQPQWLWIFDDGSTSEQQNPAPKEYKNAGNFPVKFIVNNNGCIDTVIQLLQVDPKPAVAITPPEATLCEGSHATLTASGGTIYNWAPAAGLNVTNSASTNASPLVSTVYAVTVTSAHGCTSKDSVNVEVIHPFTMQAEAEATVCLGKSVTLQVSGADTYQWINNTTGLNNTHIASPIATPAATTIYTVTGTDSHKCFTDTATIQVTVAPLPVTDAGQSAVILSGTSYQLQSTSSNDVVKWSWSPSQYLSCSDCASPVATPSQPEIYTLTVTNAAGCVASDTVSVKLFCSESRIFIPTAFTPNGDGLNELFSIRGDGIRIVNYFRIYDRWGTLVFEHSNFQIGDKSGSWNGRYKGVLATQGTYVYFASLSCGEQTFVQKGTITVLY